MDDEHAMTSVMVVDDTPANLKLLTGLLQGQGYRVLAFPSGRLALSAAAKNPPDLILLDINMPDMDGYEVCRRFKADDNLRSIPIIFISALSATKDITAGFECGGVDYISKPFHEPEVIARVRTHIGLRRAQTELDAVRARYFDLYDLAPAGYLTINEDGLILEANLAATTLLGLARGSLVKRPFSQFILKEYQDNYVLHHKQLFEARSTGSTVQQNSVQGSTQASSLRQSSGQAGQTVQASSPQPSELRMLKKDGSSFWAHLETTLVLDSIGTPVCRTVISDISESKHAEEVEKEKLEIQLRQLKKMEAIGHLVGGIAHDFNNMLTVINGYSKIVLNKISPSDPNYSRIQKISKSGERSAELTKQLLAFATKQVIAPKELDLNVAVTGILSMLKRLIGGNITVVWRPSDDLLKIKIDPSQLDQILMNLLVNTRDAISGVGKVVVETGSAQFDEASCRADTALLPGEYAVLSVSDNGCGMDKETLERIFEPFFTTKAAGKGTGLGLSTVFGIVKQNNGFIKVSSEPEKGTAFKIYLPRHSTYRKIRKAGAVARNRNLKIKTQFRHRAESGEEIS
jgi:PAS domain S-box-containing protein